MKKFITITLTFIIGMSMTLMPALAAENEYAGDPQAQTEETIGEGHTVRCCRQGNLSQNE